MSSTCVATTVASRPTSQQTSLCMGCDASVERGGSEADAASNRNTQIATLDQNPYTFSETAVSLLLQ
jgi:hypothetical protein